MWHVEPGRGVLTGEDNLIGVRVLYLVYHYKYILNKDSECGTNRISLMI